MLHRAAELLDVLHVGSPALLLLHVTREVVREYGAFTSCDSYREDISVFFGKDPGRSCEKAVASLGG